MIQLITNEIEIDNQRLSDVLDLYIIEQIAEIMAKKGGNSRNLTRLEQIELEKQVIEQMKLHIEEYLGS